jgi:serine/threonine protein kinase
MGQVWRARFTREAQTLAALNHPHIAAIHGLEESGGVTALVMELVEGEAMDQGSGIRDQGSGIRDQGAGWDQRAWPTRRRSRRRR